MTRGRGEGPRVAVVTGATSGIGLETARGLAAAGWNVVLACRDLPRAEAVRAELMAAHAVQVSCVALDLASLESVRACGEGLARKLSRLDLLVNNAGVFCDTRQRTAEGFEATIGVNFLGTMAFTRLLVPAGCGRRPRPRRRCSMPRSRPGSTPSPAPSSA